MNPLVIATSKESGPVAQAASGLTALAWTDDRIGNNGIYVQNINADCSLGK